MSLFRMSLVCLALFTTVACQTINADYSDNPAHSAQIYDTLIKQMKNQNITEGAGSGKTRVGQGVLATYRNISQGNKALTMCINWDQSSASRIDYKHFWASYGGVSSSRTIQESLRTCKRKAKGEDCVCQLVDLNDQNKIQIPLDFAKKL